MDTPPPVSDAPPLLELRQATVRFGGLTAVNGVNLRLFPGGLYGLIGPNGAGKSTLFNLITGLYQPTEGEVLFSGHSLRSQRPHQIARLGIARTFQNIRLFSGLSVFDNVRVACNLHRTTSPWHTLLRLNTFQSDEAAITAQVNSLLTLFSLQSFSDQPATSLPYGEQRRLEIVRCLATRPQLLLLDEPAAGMNPTEKLDLIRLIREVRERFALTILLVEHSMRVVMDVCEHITVLDHGTKIAEGSPAQIKRDPAVAEAYLGSTATATPPEEESVC